jgi:hypothetical protein
MGGPAEALAHTGVNRMRTLDKGGGGCNAPQRRGRQCAKPRYESQEGGAAPTDAARIGTRTTRVSAGRAVGFEPVHWDPECASDRRTTSNVAAAVHRAVRPGGIASSEAKVESVRRETRRRGTTPERQAEHHAAGAGSQHIVAVRCLRKTTQSASMGHGHAHHEADASDRGSRITLIGLLVNVALCAVKAVAGLYAPTGLSSPQAHSCRPACSTLPPSWPMPHTRCRTCLATSSCCSPGACPASRPTPRTLGATASTKR